MSGVEFGLAVVGGVDIAIRYGKTLIETCSAFNNAGDELSERVVRIGNSWKRTSLQLEFLQRVWQDLDDEHQVIQCQILDILVGKLATADSKITGFLKMIPAHEASVPEPTQIKQAIPRKLKYALLKQYLDKTIEDMEAWREQFDPSWYLMLRIANPHVQTELKAAQGGNKAVSTAFSIRDSLQDEPEQKMAVFLPPEGLKNTSSTPIPFSSAHMFQRAGSSSWLIMESISCNNLSNAEHRRKFIRNLAQKLMRADPAVFGLLKCAGAVGDLKSKDTDFKLIFKVPEGLTDPQTLRFKLMAPGIIHSLSDRFRLAKQLATAVCSIHTFGFVHKSIRPDNIILFLDGVSTLGSGFLLGFEALRQEDGQTFRSGDTNWDKNLYRHPQRQGLQLQEVYVMQHDIYSLGVCLLEIGLWESFIQYTSNPPQPTQSALYPSCPTISDNSSRAEAIKDCLLKMAREALPAKMGSKYAGIVETCLKCLDEGNPDFGEKSNLYDDDGVLVAVRYIEKVLMQLSDISV